MPTPLFRTRRLVVCGLVGLVALVTSCDAAPTTSTPSAAPSTATIPTTRASASKTGTSPQHPPATPVPRTSTTAPTSPSPLRAVRSYLATRQGSVTVGVYDRLTRTTWLLHRGLREDTASIVKLQIMGAELRHAQLSGIGLSADNLTLTREMIEASDNDAATELWDQDGGANAIAAFDRTARMSQTSPSSTVYIPGTTLPGWGLTTTTARDQLRLMKDYAYPNRLLDGDSRQYALSLMDNIEAGQNWGVTAGVPAGVRVALKNGWLPLANRGWQIDSVGWVDGDGRNYLLAVLAAGNPDEGYGIETADHISASVYDALAPEGR